MKKPIGRFLFVFLGALLIASCNPSTSSSNSSLESEISSLLSTSDNSSVVSDSSASTTSTSDSTSTSFSSTSESPVVAAYYKTVNWTQSGEDLKKSLADLLNTTSKTMPGYAGLRTYLAKCDLDPNGSGKILGFYDETKVGPGWDGGTTWNREHVWPNSRGGSAAEGDPHMIRPAAVSTNGDRGNDMYAEKGAYDPGKYIERYRGIASRIILYTATRYWADGLKLTENVSDAPSNKTMGKLSELLKWNLQYPVDITETHRNNIIYGDYNVRNVFIDHPEAACKIWGSFDSETAGVCKIS